MNITTNRTNTLTHLLDQLPTGEGNNTLRGQCFDMLVTYWLKNSTTTKDQVKHVWRFEQWPGARTGDHGIDLVVETHDGDLWAVQNKGYAETTKVNKQPIDSFIAASGTGEFTQRILITSTNRMSVYARDVCSNQRVHPVKIVNFTALDESTIAWPSTLAELAVDAPEATRLMLSKDKNVKPRKELREHQRAAVDAVLGHFGAGHERATLLMACGTGKTLTCWGMAHELEAKATLVLLPSLNLVQQTLNEWREQTSGYEGMRAVAVCSDAGIAGQKAHARRTGHGEVEDLDPMDVFIPVRRDATDLAFDLAGHAVNKPTEPLVVFSTYHSSHLVAEAQKIAADNNIDATFDLVISDEAHYLSGQRTEDFSSVLDSERIVAHRRLFATATPRYASSDVAAKAGRRVTSMDDESLFGPVVHELSFPAAINMGLLCDYKVIVVGVDDEATAEAIRERQLVELNNGATVGANTFAGLFAMTKVMKEYDLRSGLSFHNRNEGAFAFAAAMRECAFKGALTNVDAHHISGEHSANSRKKDLTALGRARENDRRVVVSNARCLTEGVDIPGLEAVMFADPRRSTVAVAQGVGRVIRRDPTGRKEFGIIIIPVVIGPGEDADEVLRTSSFDKVHEVILTLAMLDTRLAEEITELRTALGRGETVAEDALDHIVIDLPEWAADDLATKLRTQIVRTASADFDEMLGRIQVYGDAHGHTRVPTSYVDPQGHKVGAYVARMRKKKRAGTLPEREAKKLESLTGWTWAEASSTWFEGFEAARARAAEQGHTRFERGTVEWQFQKGQREAKDTMSAERRALLEGIVDWSWDRHEDHFAAMLSALVEFQQRTGTLRPKVGEVMVAGSDLNMFVNRRRSLYKEKRLSAEHIAALEALDGWVWYAKDAEWEESFVRYARYIELHGSGPIAHGTTFEGVNVAKFRQNQVQNYRDAQKGKKKAFCPNRKARLDALGGISW